VAATTNYTFLKLGRDNLEHPRSPYFRIHFSSDRLKTQCMQVLFLMSRNSNIIENNKKSKTMINV
jgi:hypothetical protein